MSCIAWAVFLFVLLVVAIRDAAAMGTRTDTKRPPPSRVWSEGGGQDVVKTPPTRVSGEGGEVRMVVVVPEGHYLKTKKTS